MKSDENTQYYQGFSVQDGGKSTAICLLLILIPFISVKKKNPILPVRNYYNEDKE